MSKRTPEEFARLPWLHIYAQESWHGDALIAGTRAGLTNLRDAIDRALGTGMEADADGIVADGEGYSTRVVIRSYEALAAALLPYTADYARDTSDKDIP